MGILNRVYNWIASRRPLRDDEKNAAGYWKHAINAHQQNDSKRFASFAQQSVETATNDWENAHAAHDHAKTNDSLEHILNVAEFDRQHSRGYPPAAARAHRDSAENLYQVVLDREPSPEQVQRVRNGLQFTYTLDSRRLANQFKQAVNHYDNGDLNRFNKTNADIIAAYQKVVCDANARQITGAKEAALDGMIQIANWHLEQATVYRPAVLRNKRITFGWFSLKKDVEAPLARQLYTNHTDTAKKILEYAAKQSHRADIKRKAAYKLGELNHTLAHNHAVRARNMLITLNGNRNLDAVESGISALKQYDRAQAALTESLNAMPQEYIYDARRQEIDQYLQDVCDERNNLARAISDGEQQIFNRAALISRVYHLQ